MESGNVRTTMRDDAHSVTYHVIAPRVLSRIEMYRIILEYRRSHKTPKRKSNNREATIVIHALGSALMKVK